MITSQNHSSVIGHVTSLTTALVEGSSPFVVICRRIKDKLASLFAILLNNERAPNSAESVLCKIIILFRTRTYL